MTISTLCVFCGSSPVVSEVYFETARTLGSLCAREKWNVVYGGAHVGLMGAMADAALAGGAKVTGVMPQHLIDREVAHTGLSHFHVTQSMHERQKLMAELSDAFAILPGGLGTLAEFFEIVTWRLLGLHDKPIIVINTDGYWDPQLEMLRKITAAGFLPGGLGRLLKVIEEVEDLPGVL